MPEIHNLPEADYHADPALSCSKLKPLSKSPAHFLHALEQPHTTTPAMALGSLLHSAALEGPASIARHYAIAPQVDRRTKAGKAEYAEFLEASEDKTIVTAEQMELAEGMAAAIAENATATKLLEQCATRETSFFWQADDVPMKARLDACSPDGIIVDLKTIGTPIDQFQRQAYNLQYHLQAAIYSEAYREVRGTEPEAFVFIVVESTPPHGVSCFLASAELIGAGDTLFGELLDTYKACTKQGEWPGYPDELRMLDLPAWAKGGRTND